MTEGGSSGEQEPNLSWVDIEDAYTRVYLRGEQSDEFTRIDGDTETLRVYLRYRPFNLMIGRPLFPEKAQGIAFWIQVTTPAHRPELPRELYAALADENELMVLRNDALEEVGADKTEEILKMIRGGHLLPWREFEKELE